MSCVKGNEEQNLWIQMETRLMLACKYSPTCQDVGPCLLGGTLKQLI